MIIDDMMMNKNAYDESLNILHDLSLQCRIVATVTEDLLEDPEDPYYKDDFVQHVQILNKLIEKIGIEDEENDHGCKKDNKQ